MKKIARLRLVKVIDTSREIIDFAEPILHYIQRKLLKRSGEKSKKRFKKLLDKYEIE